MKKAFVLGCFLGSILSPIIIVTTIVTLTPLIVPKIVRFITPPSASSSATALPVNAKNCGTDPTCILAAAQSCNPASGEISQGGFSLIFKVVGKSQKILGNCRVALEVGPITDPKFQFLGLQGQNMVCDVAPKIITSPTSLLTAPDSDLNCDGALWGLLKIVRAGQKSTP